jgi:hypothetical protein
MTVLRDAMAAVEWWKLEPAHDLLRGVPESNLERPVLAASRGRSLAGGYTPARAPVGIEMQAFPGRMKAQWLDPLTGARTPAVHSGGEFTPPAAGEDWALVLLTEPNVR